MKKVVIALLVCFLALPVLGVGYVWAGCSVKMSALNGQTSDIQGKIEQSNLGVMKSLEVHTDGDCLTGSGTSFSFTIEDPVGSPNSIAQEILAELDSSGIPTPNDISTPSYLFGQDGNVTGGDTPIHQIYVTYDVGNNFDRYSFTYQLPEKIPCSFDQTREEAICNGVEKDQLLKQLLNTAQVISVDVGGSVRKP